MELRQVVVPSNCVPLLYPCYHCPRNLVTYQLGQILCHRTASSLSNADYSSKSEAYVKHFLGLGVCFYRSLRSFGLVPIWPVRIHVHVQLLRLRRPMEIASDGLLRRDYPSVYSCAIFCVVGLLREDF